MQTHYSRGTIKCFKDAGYGFIALNGVPNRATDVYFKASYLSAELAKLSSEELVGVEVSFVLRKNAGNSVASDITLIHANKPVSVNAQDSSSAVGATDVVNHQAGVIEVSSSTEKFLGIDDKKVAEFKVDSINLFMLSKYKLSIFASKALGVFVKVSDGALSRLESVSEKLGQSEKPIPLKYEK